MQKFFVLSLILLVLGCDQRHQRSPEPPVGGCPSEILAEAGSELLVALPTDAGMHALWDPAAFRNICSYEQWEKQLLNDASIERHIRAGKLVPLYVYSDGTPSIGVRVGSSEKPAEISLQEREWLVDASEPYKFESAGYMTVSGIEYVDGAPNSARKTIHLANGTWGVTVHYLDAPEGARLTENQLYPPDFLVLVNPASTNQVFRGSVETFRRNIWETLNQRSAHH